MKYILIIVVMFFSISLTSSKAQELTPEQIYEKTNDCVVVIFSYDFNGKKLAQGSGVVINDKGWIVTNYHVFAECEKMEVKHNNKIIKYTDIVVFDIEKDILILKIEDNTFPSITISNSDNLKVGQRVYAIGSPLGLENTMSEGIISGIRSIDLDNKNYIQITASISPGSSGGAVINSKGELVGISTLTLVEGQNMNFAIPINDIMAIAQDSFGDKKHIEIINNDLKGYNALVSGNYNEAIKYYTEFIKIFPKDALALSNRGLAYFHLRDYSKAISDYNKAIEVNPKYEISYNNLGNVFNTLKEYDKAILNYSKAIEIKPDYENAYNNRANAFSNLKDYTKAILDYNKVIEFNPDDDKAYYSRGFSYSNIKNYSLAISDFTKAISLNSNYIEAYYFRGLVYLDTKEYYKAITDFNKAIEINPNNDNPYLARGMAYYYLGNTIRACEDWHKASSLGSKISKDNFEKYCK